jgi:hypothetical protein
MIDTSGRSGRTSRSRGIRAIGGLLCLTAFATFSGPTLTATGPRISSDRHEIDLGEVVKGDVVETRFELRNTGDELLQIVRVKPG